MIKEPYIRIKTIDYSNLSDTVPDSLNTAMVINSDTGPTAVTKISTATQLIKYYSTKQQLTVTDDVTFKHAAKLLQFTPIYLTRAFDNSVLAGYTDRGDLIYTDLEYNHLPFSLKVEIPEPTPNNEVTLTQRTADDGKEEVTNKSGSIITPYDEFIARLNGASNVSNKFFKVQKSNGSWVLVSEDNAIEFSTLSEVSNRFLSDWSWIKFNVSSGNKLKASDYISINGYSFYPAGIVWDNTNNKWVTAKEFSSGNEQYPNVPVAINIRLDSDVENYTCTDGNGGLIDFQLGLLDKLNSGEYGLSEAWGFTNTVSVDGTFEILNTKSSEDRTVVTSSDVKLFVDVSSGLNVYSNNLVFTPGGENKLWIKSNANLYTLPYDSSAVIKNITTVDTSEVNTLYGLIELIASTESSTNISYTFDNNISKIYIKNTEVDSYVVGTQTWTDKSLNNIKSALETKLPTEDSLATEASIGSFWIRIQDYVFYNIVIDDIRVRNNPDLEQIKISTAPLTYKQLLVKLRKAVGDVFNSTNTPNGFTLFWRAMPDRTKFGSSKVSDKEVTWNGNALVDGKAEANIAGNNDVVNGVIKNVSISDNGSGYATPPIVKVDGGNGKAQLLSKIDSSGKVTSILVLKGGLEYLSTNKVTILPAVQITDSTAVVNSAKFAVIARFPSKTPVLQFSYVRQDLEKDSSGQLINPDADPELYTFSLEYKGENVGDSTISFIPDKIDGYQRSVYFTYYNDINDFVQIIPLEGEINFKQYKSKLFGDEIPVVEPEVDDYISAAQRFKAKDGTYYDFVFDGGYVNAAYAKNLIEICKGGSEDSLWAQAMLSCIDDKDYKDRILYREATAIDNCNAQMFGDWVVDTTIADFAIDISATAIAIEKIYANRDVGKEFACIFGPANGAMQYKPKYPIIDKDIREKLLNKQINTLVWDNSLQLSYFNLDITLQSADSSMSDCNNCRTVNCQSHIADNYMKWFWGRVNDEATRNEAIQGLMYRINQRCINNQQYHIDDYIIVCNETNNPPNVVENRQLVVDVKDKFRPGIRYINVFNKIYRLTQDFNAIG